MKWTELKKGYENQLERLASTDPYQLLGVPHEVSATALRRAYLDMVKAYHPDHADPFVKEHHQEILKLINAAFNRIRKEHNHAS
jgi:curved DNA-binding protein CbpA